MATKATEKAISQLVDYVPSYPNDGTIYRSSGMIYAAHSDASFNNELKGFSCAGAHIFLSEDGPEPRWNGPILTIAQIIKLFMPSAAEAELGTLYVAAK